MAGARNSAGDHSFMNKVYKPVVSYAKNVGKQVSDYTRAYSKTIDLQDKGRTYPPGKREAYQKAANAASREDKRQFGQALGSLIGRRYKD